MARAAKGVLDVDKIDVVADRCYFSSKEILASHNSGITATIPKINTSPHRNSGLYVKADRQCDAEQDVYFCPAGQRLIYRHSSEERGLTLRRYYYNDCPNCPLYAQCTTGKERRITRWEHEHLIEEMQDRLDQNPNKMRERISADEHPFGTIKAWMGATHFQVKKLKNVSTVPRPALCCRSVPFTGHIILLKSGV